MKTLERNHADKVAALIYDFAVAQGFTPKEADDFAYSFWLMLTGHELER